jgi:hypothetical protein
MSKPNWLISLEYSVGSPDYGNNTNTNSNTEEELKSASTMNAEVPNWVISLRHTCGSF